MSHVCIRYPVDTEEPHWKMCKCFDRTTSQVLDVQFGDGQTSLKVVSVNCYLFGIGITWQWWILFAICEL